MEFSIKYLHKYGWKEGEGLGKNQTGIKQAIKPKLKFDKQGMGYNPSCEFTDQWWTDLYNNALDNISNTATDDNHPNINCGNKDESYSVKNKKRKKNSEDLKLKSLLEVCEGRTNHKGARHGLTLSGKLQRLQEQEETMMHYNSRHLQKEK